MYYYLHGLIALHNKNSVVIECQGVGYECLVARISDFPLGEVMYVYVYHYIREDENIFVGFKSLEEKDIYSSLNTVKGVGIKTALSILSVYSSIEIKEAIKKSDVKFFQKVPGIAIKTAQQIILDIKGKLKDSNIGIIELNKNKDVAKNALIALGYRDNDVIEILNNIKDENLTEQEYTKLALQKINNNGSK